MIASAETSPWSERNNREIIEHIIDCYHEPLREDFARLCPLAAKVLRADLFQTLARLRQDLEPHMEWEERVLFPWLLSGRPIPRGGPVHVGIFEHDHATDLLDCIRNLTGGFTVPAGASDDVRALWSGLESLDHTMREHLYLENEILFPRAHEA
ncbi:MAG: hemerythrin domain-containing protein [Myxococcaceae bacterium]